MHSLSMLHLLFPADFDLLVRGFEYLNMKLMMNATRPLEHMTVPNIEISELTGPENIKIGLHFERGPAIMLPAPTCTKPAQPGQHWLAL